MSTCRVWPKCDKIIIFSKKATQKFGDVKINAYICTNKLLIFFNF